MSISHLGGRVERRIMACMIPGMVTPLVDRWCTDACSQQSVNLRQGVLSSVKSDGDGFLEVLEDCGRLDNMEVQLQTGPDSGSSVKGVEVDPNSGINREDQIGQSLLVCALPEFAHGALCLFRRRGEWWFWLVAIRVFPEVQGHKIHLHGFGPFTIVGAIKHRYEGGEGVRHYLCNRSVSTVSGDEGTQKMYREHFINTSSSGSHNGTLILLCFVQP